MNCSSKDKRLVFARHLEELWIQMSGKKLSEPFLSPLLPLDPPHNFFNEMKQQLLSPQPPVTRSEEPQREETTSSLSSPLVLDPPVPAAVAPAATESSLISTPPSDESSPPPLSSAGDARYVDLYSILLKIRQLKYETKLELFLEDIELLSLHVKRILEAYHPPQLLAHSTLHTSTPALVSEEEELARNGYTETISQSLSTILFQIHHLPKEKRDKLTSDEFIQLPLLLPSSSAPSSALALDVKLLRIWRRECSVSLTHLRELYLSKEYFENDFQAHPVVLPRSLPSWCNYLNSSCSPQQSQSPHLSSQNSSQMESQLNLMVSHLLPPFPALSPTGIGFECHRCSDGFTNPS
jgi:hypothetical protein